MPDVACPYTLVTPGGTIQFNDGATDQFYITNIPQGLSGPPLRTPIDDVAFGDGSRGHNFWKSGRHILIEGIFLTPMSATGDARATAWNVMEDSLLAALASIASDTADTGTLTWTPIGFMASRSLTVRHDVPLECPPGDNYLVRAFNFGLFAENPDW
jgi:hypothetical protein